MKLPIRELEVVQLAQDMSRGLSANPEVFPAPPAGAETIDEAIAAYHAARESSVEARARAKRRTTAKQEAFAALSDLVRSGVRYAESVAGDDTGKLRLVGWGKPRKAVPKAEPGQVGPVEVRQEGPTWVTLAWSAPTDGGAVSAYRIQCRYRSTGAWKDVGTAVGTEVTVREQESGVELEYRVIGVNAAGDGPASNIVRVVL